MAFSPLLKHAEPEVDRGRIGISYSGGGPLVLVEMGAVRAFVERGIRPEFVAGVSAGAMAATAHALDPEHGRGVDMAVEIMSKLSSRFLGLTAEKMLEKVLRERHHLASLADHSPLRPLIVDGIERHFRLHDPKVGDIAPPQHPRLLVGATEWTQEDSYWFGPDEPLADALVASAAIPGLFPWQKREVDGQVLALVDGGVVANQPLSRLALEGCGTIFACAFSRTAGVPLPANALGCALGSVRMMMRHSMKLEAEYVQLKLGDQGDVHHVDIDVDIPVHGYDFTPEVIADVVERSRVQAHALIAAAGF